MVLLVTYFQCQAARRTLVFVSLCVCVLLRANEKENLWMVQNPLQNHAKPLEPWT